MFYDKIYRYSLMAMNNSVMCNNEKGRRGEDGLYFEGNNNRKSRKKVKLSFNIQQTQNTHQFE